MVYPKKKGMSSKSKIGTSRSGKADDVILEFNKIQSIPDDAWYLAVINSITVKDEAFVIGVSPYSTNKSGKKSFFSKAYLWLNKNCEPESLTEKFMEMFEIKTSIAFSSIKGKEMEVFIEINDNGNKTFYNVTKIRSLEDDEIEDDEIEDDDLYE